MLTLDTMLKCVVPIEPTEDGDKLLVICDQHINVGCTLMYRYNATAGCSYYVYNRYNDCLSEYHFDGVNDRGTRGGGFTIDANVSYVAFSRGVTLSKTANLSVAAIVSDVGSLDALYKRLTDYCVDAAYTQDIINLYLDSRGPGGGTAFTTDDTLTLDSETKVLSVNVADAVEADNTLPVSSAAVHAIIGDLEALLSSI